jgi:hypothetical protein
LSAVRAACSPGRSRVLADSPASSITALYQRNMRLTSAPCRRERDVAAVPALDG